MRPAEAYFFAQYPKDFALCAGLAAVIHELAPGVARHLVWAAEPNSDGYDWSSLTDGFDSVTQVPTAMYGTHRRFDLRGLLSAYARVLPRAKAARRGVEGLAMEPGAVCFAFDGFSLNQAVFLRCAKEAGLTTVLITEQTSSASLSDFTHDSGESLYLSFINRRAGTAEVDLFRMRTAAGERTSQREYRFRSSPAGSTFAGVHAPVSPELAPGHAYWPYYRPHSTQGPEEGSVLVLGGMFHWEPLIATAPFYVRFNELLKVVRAAHPRQRLLYLTHPAEAEDRMSEVRRLDLDGFEVVSGVSAEALALGDAGIGTAYGVVSTALFTLACLGVRSHFLYPLFADDAIPPALRRRYDERWRSSDFPGMAIDSEEAWLRGDYAYDPSLLVQRVRSATVGLLHAVGVLEHADGSMVVTPDDRGPSTVPASPLGAVRSLLGISSLGGALRKAFQFGRQTSRR